MIFADSSLTLRQCGALCRVSSDEIFDSGISVGLECLDRELFDFDRAAAVRNRSEARENSDRLEPLRKNTRRLFV